MLSYHLPIFSPLMSKKKSIDGSLCFCPLLPLPEVNPAVSEREGAGAGPHSLSGEGGITQKIHAPCPCPAPPCENETVWCGG